MATNDNGIINQPPSIDELTRHEMRAMKRHIETLLDENRRLTSALADARIEQARMYERCKPYLELPF